VLSTDMKNSEGGKERPRSTQALVKTRSSGSGFGVLESLWKLHVSGAMRPSFAKALSSEFVTSLGHH
jgi:hypothetical protein